MSRRNFVELRRRLTGQDERAYAEAWAAARPVGGLVHVLPGPSTIGPRATSQRAFLHNVARGEADPRGRLLAVGRDVRHRDRAGRAEDREIGGSYARIAFSLDNAAGGHRERDRGRHHPAGAAACLRGAGGASGRRAVRRAARHHRADPAVRGAGAGARAPAGRAGQGHRHRHGLHVRRHHGRDLVARARAGDPPGDRQGRPAAGRAAAVADPPGRPGRLRAARGHAGEGRPGPDHRPAARRRRSARRARARPACGEVRRVRRQAAGDRHHPAVVHPQRRPGPRPAGRAAGPRALARLASPAHAGQVRGLGARPGR